MTDEQTLPRCHADSDGECDWIDCPQLKQRNSHCPLDLYWQAIEGDDD